MDKDRVAGSAKQVKGTVKQSLGKAIGDARLESERGVVTEPWPQRRNRVQAR